VLDELDKLVAGPGGSTGLANAGDAWQSYIRNELYSAILDGRWPNGLTLHDDDDAPDIETLTRKLRDTVFVLGIGTFQSWFDGAGLRRSMGFAAEIAPPTDELTADIVAERMPRELANRFNSTLIRIPELREQDYHRIARETETKLPERMQAAFRAEVQRLLPGAIAAKKGVRFLEEAMLATLVSLPPEPEKIIAEITKPTPTLDLCTLW
jgi:hypothetical protein